MTDSPYFRAPLDPKEQPILDRVLHIRDKLQILKQDRSTYIKSQDVIGLYNAVIEQVEVLNQIRQSKRDEQNRGRADLHRSGEGRCLLLAYSGHRTR